jgi:L-cysteine desulfidase
MDIVANLFKKETPNKLEGRMYAVTTGDYAGQILLFVKTVDDSYWFLSIPSNNNQEVPMDKFEFGTNNDILDYIGDLPNDIFKTVKAQFKYNENSNY